MVWMHFGKAWKIRSSLATMYYHCLYTSALFLLAASSSARYASQQAISAGQSVLYYKPRPYFEPSENGYKIQPALPAIGGYSQASKPSFPAAHLGGFPIPLQQQQIQHDQLVNQNIASDEFGRGPEKPLVFVPALPIAPYSNSIVEEPSIPVVPGSYGAVSSPAYGLSTAVPVLAPYKNLKTQKATS